MSRLGRSQPIQPFATHGFLGNTPPNGTLPPTTVVVEPDDRRRKTPPPPPVVIVGTFVPPAVTANPPAPVVVEPLRTRVRPVDPVVISGPLAAVVTPPAPVNVETPRPRRQTQDPVVISGALLSVTPPAVVTPPLPLNVDRDPQRIRRQPQEPVVISGALASFPPPTVTPPSPYVIPVDERRRILGTPNITVGYDDVVPPKPTLVEPDRRRLLPLDPFASNPAAAAFTPAQVNPPAPFVVPLDQRGRFVVVLPATGQHGFVDPGPQPVGTTPPPPLNLDRYDIRYGSKPSDSLVLSGVLAPPPPDAVVTGVDDITPVFVTW